MLASQSQHHSLNALSLLSPLPVVSVRLSVQYPPTYPDVRPLLTVQSLSGLSKQQVEHISSLANTEADNSVGTECMFQISQAIRDWLVENNKPTLSMHQQMQAAKGGDDGGTAEDDEDGDGEEDEDEPQEKKDARREKREAERRAARGPSPLNIAPGTVVTTASFMEWKARFDEEQRRKREEEEKARTAREMKMTGKQLFLANLAKELQDDEADSLEEEKVEGGAARAGKDKPFWFNAAVYADDDAELPDDEEEGDDEDDEDEDEDSAATQADRAKQAEAEEQQRRKEEQQRQAEEAKEKERKRQEADRQAHQKQKTTQHPTAGKQTEAASKGKVQQPAGGGKGKDAKAKGKK